MLADEIAPPGVVAEVFAAESEGGKELYRNPARLVPPILEERLSGLEELFCESRLETLETGVEDDGVAAGAGDGDGIELEIAETLNDPLCRSSSALATSRSTTGHPGPLRFEETGPAQSEAPG
jgi:hypothetical protein